MWSSVEPNLIMYYNDESCSLQVSALRPSCKNKMPYQSLWRATEYQFLMLGKLKMDIHVYDNDWPCFIFYRSTFPPSCTYCTHDQKWQRGNGKVTHMSRHPYILCICNICWEHYFSILLIFLRKKKRTFIEMVGIWKMWENSIFLPALLFFA